MTGYIKKFKVLSVERGNNSYYGNPSYFLELIDENYDKHYVKTASNSIAGYQVHSGWVGEIKTFMYHYTRNGNMLIDKCLDA